MSGYLLFLYEIFDTFNIVLNRVVLCEIVLLCG